MILFLLVLFSYPCKSTITHYSQRINGDNYRAALYSMVVDYSRAQRVLPEIQYAIPRMSTTSYKYFIQLGSDTLIEILDPGNEVKSFSALIKILDYSKGESTSILILDHVKKYSITKESIPFSIEESKGYSRSLCSELDAERRCDSTAITLYSTRTEYNVVFNDTIPNLRSNMLLYPDLKYLPFKIFNSDQCKSPMILEEVIYGKVSIDSLLLTYDYTGYDLITEKDITPTDLNFTKELIEKLKSNN